MIFDGNKTSTSPGTPVRLASVRTVAAWVTLIPLANATTGAPANTSPIVIGGRDVAFNKGLVLGAGDAGVAFNIGDINWVDLYEVWMDVITSGDGVQFIYGVR